MPEYLAPGVFIEEVSFRHKSIEGVGTSVSAIVGPTRTGPLRGLPNLVTSYAEFERIYGDAQDISFTSSSTATPNYTAHAARAFFDNGGKQLFVSRITQGVNDSAADGSGSSASLAKSQSAVTQVTFASRFPGAASDYALEFHWKKTENLLTTITPGTTAEGETLYLGATDVPTAARVGAGPADGDFPINVTAVVKRVGDNYEVVGKAITTKAADDTPTGGSPLTKLAVAALPATTTKLQRVVAHRPANGELANGTAAVVELKKAVDLKPLNAAWDTKSLTTLDGFLNKNGDHFTVSKELNPTLGLANDLELPLAALGHALTDVKTVAAKFFDLDVHRGSKNGEVIWSEQNLSVAIGTARSLDKALKKTPDTTLAKISQPISSSLAASPTGPKVFAALGKLYEDADLHPADDSLDDPRYIIKLSGGKDGKAPAATDYAGEEDDTKGSTGLTALEGIEDISIVMVPAAAADATNHKAIMMKAQVHCRKMRYRMAIVDSRKDMSLEDVRAFRNNFDDSRLALYYPWVVASDPTGKRSEMLLPPSGFIAGIYARTDVDRGVHKSPANEVVMGALGFKTEINKFQQELLNPNGVNCLRSFPGRGHRVWGGRTLSSDPEWKYVNVRRYFLYLERSIEKSTQWAVFEPNGQALWGNIRSAVEDFLFNEWKNGHLLGASPKEAYFVRCDRSTMTQADIDNGRMICEVGVAPLRPAEFVIFRIGQKTADA